MKKQLQTQFFKTIGFRLVCCGVLLSATSPGMAEGKPSRGQAVSSESKARINITGTVKDSKGEPLPGVSVKVKGTTTGTTSDINGVFRLNLPTGDETLVLSFVGFKTQEVKVGGKTTLSVTLMDDSKALEEVVIVGYGIQKKAHLTGAVETVKPAEIQDLPVSNLSAAIAGRSLGVGVSGGTTRPGVAGTITIRNESSAAKDASSGPLYVIDGVIQISANGSTDNTLFNQLDPSEIENISILKDASAAIYGSRAAKGVILVTTKKGKAGKPRISYSGSYGNNNRTYKPDMMNAYQFASYFNIMNGPNGSNLGKTSANPQNYLFSQDELDYFKNVSYDWLDPAWSSSYNTQHNVNVSGGTETATYFANIGYFKQNGNIGKNDYDRWNFRAGAEVKAAKSLKVTLQVSGNYANLVKAFNKVGGENDNNDYKTLIQAVPYVPMYLNGYPVKLPGTTNDLSVYHFYELQRLGNLSNGKTRTTTINTSAEYTVPFVKGLIANLSYGKNLKNGTTGRIGTKYSLYQFDNKSTNGHIYDENSTLRANSIVSVSNDNQLSYINEQGESYQANFTLNYNRQFGGHSISGLFSVERAEAESSQQNASRTDPILSTNGQFSTAFGTYGGSTTGSETGSLSYIGRANWGYKDKYLAEFLFRSDASTKFAPEHYWGKFYSGSIGWVISEEDFFNVPAIDYLKIRYSAGLLGNDQTQAWAWRQRYTYENGKGAVFGSGNDGIGSSVGMKMQKSPNRDATWSDEFKNNLGVDMQFLKSRLSANVDAFFNRGTNLLLARSGNVPITVGGSIAPENYGAADTYGIEVGLGWKDKIGKDVSYGFDFRFNWSDDRTRIGNFNEEALKLPWNAQRNRSSDNGVWGYDYLGMFHSQEEIDAYVKEYNIISVFEVPVNQLRPGSLYYRDVRGPLQPDGTFAAPDGIINEYDQIQLAKKASNHFGIGSTIKLSYKSLSFDCVISGSFGGWAEYDGNARKSLKTDLTRVFENRPAFWGDVYDPDLNPNGKYPNPYYESINLSPTSNFWKVSAFRLRMRSFNLNYSLPKHIAEKLQVSNARIYLSAVNPLNLYNPYDYRDADMAYDTYPNLRTISMGLGITF